MPKPNSDDDSELPEPKIQQRGRAARGLVCPGNGINESRSHYSHCDRGDQPINGQNRIASRRVNGNSGRKGDFSFRHYLKIQLHRRGKRDGTVYRDRTWLQHPGAGRQGGYSMVVPALVIHARSCSRKVQVCTLRRRFSGIAHDRSNAQAPTRGAAG
jgi:hypothetical protein